jgi:hypothetical protein
VIEVRWLVALALACGCKDEPRKMTMAPEDVIEAVRDFADRGCACETDKECFRTVRDEWEAVRRELVGNAKLMTGDHLAGYQAERLRFGRCGDAAGLTVWDKF